MKFTSPLLKGTLLRRYKRFLADVQLNDTLVTAHVANTGSMLGCALPGSPVALSHHPDKGRKLPYSLELVHVDDTWVCVNTALPNRIVEEALLAGDLEPLAGYPTLRREVRYGANSRIDLLLTRDSERCYVEVKNVTLRLGGVAAFPDAVTTRGRKHLLELMDVVRQGHRGVMLFLVNRGDCDVMRPAHEIDPEYARSLEAAAHAGVELMAYRTEIDITGIRIACQVPVRLS